MVRFVLVVFLFTVLLIFVSISVCQCLWSVRDCQDIKKQLTGFSSLPSLYIWISFCKRLLGPVMYHLSYCLALRSIFRSLRPTPHQPHLLHNLIFLNFPKHLWNLAYYSAFKNHSENVSINTFILVFLSFFPSLPPSLLFSFLPYLLTQHVRPYFCV